MPIKNNPREEILEALEDLPESELEEILDFVKFLQKKRIYFFWPEPFLPSSPAKRSGKDMGLSGRESICVITEAIS